MKKKFITLFLSFLIVFNSINYSYADVEEKINSEGRFVAVAGVSLSPQVIASLGALLVVGGVNYLGYKDLNSSIRDIYETSNFKEDILPLVESAIKTSVDGVVTFGKEVIDWFNEVYFPTVSTGENLVISDIPCYSPSQSELKYFNPGGTAQSGSLSLDISPYWEVFYGTSVTHSLGNGFELVYDGSRKYVELYYNGSYVANTNISLSTYRGAVTFLYIDGKIHFSKKLSTGWGCASTDILSKLSNLSDSDFVKTWSNVGSLPNLNSDSVSIPIPNNVNDLIGSNSWNPSKEQVWLPGGTISIPTLDNPLVNVGEDIIIDSPSIDTPVDPPVDTPVDTTWDWLFNLVVPSDIFWTNAFNDFMSNFNNSFPNIDTSSFMDLIVEGKKFPNIDVNIMGSKGRIVDGDIVNSIVDWLRPIIAGFFMLLLMLFNYAKIYKTIRGTSPFKITTEKGVS